MTSNTWKVIARKASLPSNPDPNKMQAGDVLEIVGPEEDGWIWCRNRAGKESWVPLSYLTAQGEGKTRTALFDYEAAELPVEVGEEFQVELEEHGWLWCKNRQGKLGWVRYDYAPTNHARTSLRLRK